MKDYYKPAVWMFSARSLAKRNPFAPRVRKSFWLLAFIGVWHIALLDPVIRIPVIPVAPIQANATTLAEQNSAFLAVGQEIELKQPDIWQRLLLKDEKVGCSLLSICMLIAGCLLIIFITPRKKNDNIFQRDVTRLIWLLGSVILLHFILMAYTHQYENTIVRELTHNEYTTQNQSLLLLWTEGYIGFVVIAFGSWYRKGVVLQKEQELTV